MAAQSITIVQPDDWRINMSDSWQVLWWCRYLGLTKSQLETAIQSAGTVIIDVKRYLARQQAMLNDVPPSKSPAGAAHITSRTVLNRSPF